MHIKCEKLHVFLSDEGIVMKCVSLCHRAVKEFITAYCKCITEMWQCSLIKDTSLIIGEHVCPGVLKGNLGMEGRHVRALTSKRTVED